MGLLEQLLAAGDVPLCEIGIVTPYMGQVRLLRAMWRERPMRVCIQLTHACALHRCGC